MAEYIPPECYTGNWYPIVNLCSIGTKYSYIRSAGISRYNNTTLLGSMPPPPFESLSAQQIATSTNKTCTLTPSLIEIEGTPQQIEGPYFVDGMPNRSDLRSSDGTIQEGIPLYLNLNVYDVDDDGSCVPFSGAKVDIWEANPQGIYSGVAEDRLKERTFSVDTK